MHASGPPALEWALRALFGDRIGALDQLGAGEWSRAYATTLDGREVVVRVGGHVADFAKDRYAGRWNSARLPVPSVLHIGPVTDGQWFAVSDRRHGEFLDALDGPGMARVLPALLDTMGAIADLDVSGITGYGAFDADGSTSAASWREALLSIAEPRPRLGDWRALLASSAVGCGSFDTGMTELRRLVADLPDVAQLVHGDLLNRNVLVEDDRVTAVFDWGNAVIGDALYDAAWLRYWWPWYPAWSGIDVDASIIALPYARALTPAELRRRLRAYELHIGLDHLAYTAATGRDAGLLRNDQQVRALLAQR